MRVEIIHAYTEKVLETFTDLSEKSTIEDVKKLFAKARPKFYADRQSYRPDARGRPYSDNTTLGQLTTPHSPSVVRLYFKDLGPQIGWGTVFFCEYAGPLAVYALFYTRPTAIYGVLQPSLQDHHWAVRLAMGCWTFHYAKRILETLFVHKFSHSTMPLRNLFKNCFYYWGFAAFIGYFNNHPLYTPAAFGDAQIFTGLGLFALSELGNFSIHWALSNLRPAGSKVRLIPKPTANPLTLLFKWVSCPNYTYEALAWIGFSVMTQSLPAALFTAAGLYQMTMWALGKQKAYKREFPDYPRRRRAIIPFLV